MSKEAGSGRAPVRLGVAFVPWANPPERLPQVARACDGVLDDLWVWEDCFTHGGLSSASAALAVTTRLRVGLGLMPTPLRNVALTAMEIATVQRMFPGRFAPGIGHGVQDWMAQVGAKPASVLTLLDEYATALTALLHGDEVSVEGRYVKLRGVQLKYPPGPDEIGVMIGATGPKSLELAGRLSDGYLLSGGGPEVFQTAREAVERGRAAAGRQGEPHYMVGLVAATGDDGEERVRRELPFWGSEPGPGVSAWGSAESVAEQVRGSAERGAGTVVVQPTMDEPDLLGLIRFLGEEVKPLL